MDIAGICENFRKNLGISVISCNIKIIYEPGRFGDGRILQILRVFIIFATRESKPIIFSESIIAVQHNICIAMKNVTLFLKELNLIRDDYERRAKRTEQFNIFSVLCKSSDEVNLHSRFISSLLNPGGSHQLSDFCLRTFLDVCGYPEQFAANLLAPGVEVYPNEYDLSERNEIDILIINRRTSFALFIENKIYAKDSNHEEHGQLEGYYQVLMDKYRIPEGNIEAVFLSLDRDPSEESIGNRYPRLKEVLKIIHYNDIIIEWLDKCLKASVDKPFLRETILQYIKLIREMTNDTSVEERIEIKELIGKSKDNMASTKLLIENFKHVKWHTVVDFWNELTQKLQSIGYEITENVNLDDVTFVTHNELYKQGYKNRNFGICFRPKDGLHMYVWYEFGYSLYYGICNDENLSAGYKSRIKRLCTLDDLPIAGDDELSAYQDFELPEEEQIWFDDFLYDGTFNLINDDYRHRIIDKIVIDIQKFVERLDSISL